jgi:hypothetical protein
MGIRSKLGFVFAQATSEEHFSGNQMILEVILESEVKNGHRISSSTVRKYIATEMMWLNISDQQRKMYV